MKLSEARIIIFLRQTPIHFHYPTVISTKLQMDIAYLSRMLNNMIEKNWVYRELIRSLIPSMRNKQFYHLTKLGLAQTEEAKNTIVEGEQTKLTKEE